MDENKKHLEDLTHIRSLMERSSRFLSLSGLSGVFAGIYALIGASIVYFDFKAGNVSYAQYVRSAVGEEQPTVRIYYLIGVAVLVLLASVVTGFAFTSRKAKKQNLKMWDGSAKLMMSNLLVPLVAGGILGIILLQSGDFKYVAPITLLFYGLGLYSASKYSFVELRYLGLCEILLGLVGCWFIGYGLLLWSVGFGVLHILYGGFMYFKYERN
jgi:hypothetical protein